MKKHFNPTTRASRRYFIEFFISMTVYVIVLFMSLYLAHRVSEGWRVPIAVLPVIPIGFVFASIVRFCLHTDEFNRQVMVTSLALAGGATALLTVTYGLFESFDLLPRPSAWWFYATFMLGWVVANVFVKRRYQ